MKHAFAHGIEAEITDDALIITATGALAKAGLGGPRRELPLDSITAIEWKKPTALALGTLYIADQQAKTQLNFAAKTSADVETFLAALRERCADAADGVAKGVPLWTAVRFGTHGIEGWKAGIDERLEAQAEKNAAERLVMEQKRDAIVAHREDLLAQRDEQRAASKQQLAARREQIRVAEDKVRANWAEAKAKTDAMFARMGRFSPEEREEYGELMADGRFANHAIQIFANGYVAMGMARAGKPEPLLGIKAEADVTKKTGIGRAVVATLTYGANLQLTSGKRGDAYLTISTPSGAKALHTTDVQQLQMTALRKLEAAGLAVIRLREMREFAAQTGTSPSPTATPIDLAVQLQSLAELHDAGSLSDEEFASAKARLLGA